VDSLRDGQTELDVQYRPAEMVSLTSYFFLEIYILAHNINASRPIIHK